MKKIVLNISDSDYEMFRFEAIHHKKSVQDVIRSRLLSPPFDQEVITAFEKWENEKIYELLKD